MPDIAGSRGVGCASGVSDQVAFFAENGASLHGLLANAASDSYPRVSKRGYGRSKEDKRRTFAKCGLDKRMSSRRKVFRTG